MSLRAVSYVLEMTHAPDGYQLNSTDGMVLTVLADCHHPERDTVWPSISTIREKSKCKSDTTVKETIRRLEEHLIIERIRPDNQGRGQSNSYIFLDLDAPTRLRWKMVAAGVIDDEPKGGEIRPLSQGELITEEGRLKAGLEPLQDGQKGAGRGRISAKKGAGRGSEGGKIDHRYKEEPRTGNRIESGTGPTPQFDELNTEQKPVERRVLPGHSSDRFDSEESYTTTNSIWPNPDLKPGHANLAAYNTAIEDVCRERHCTPQEAAEWIDARVVERALEVRKWPETELAMCPMFTSLLRSGRYKQDLSFWRHKPTTKAAKAIAAPPVFDREKFKRENGA